MSNGEQTSAPNKGKFPTRLAVVVVFCLGAVLLIMSVKPGAPKAPAPAASAREMTKEAFQLRVLHHWFPTENRDDPPADVQALLHLERGEELDGGWQVRGIRVTDNAIQIEVIRPGALFITRVQLGTVLGTLVQTERYSLTVTNTRPGPQFFTDEETRKAVESIAKHIREHEKQVPAPKGLTLVPTKPLPPPPIPGEPTAVVPEAGAPSNAPSAPPSDAPSAPAP